MRTLERNLAIAMLLTLAWGGATLLVKPATLLGKPAQSFESIPVAIGGWTGADIDSTDASLAVPGCSVLMRNYADGSGAPINLTMVYGYDLTDLHKPDYCLEGSGWKIESRRSVEVASHRAVILQLLSPDGEKAACLYWFAGPTGATDAFAQRKLDVFRRALLNRRMEPTTLVRLMTPATARPRLTEFAAMLDSHVEGMFGMPQER